MADENPADNAAKNLAKNLATVPAGISVTDSITGADSPSDGKIVQLHSLASVKGSSFADSSFTDSSVTESNELQTISVSPDFASAAPTTTNPNLATNLASKKTEFSFWVSSSQFFDTALVLLQAAPTPFEVFLYDCDGALVNRLTLSFPRGQLGALDLSELMEGCKIESGIRHAQLVVSTDPTNQVVCRMHSKDYAASLGASQQLTADHSLFFPLTFSDEKSYLLAFSNCSKAPAQVRCRLFFGKRNPEHSCTVPPLGSRIVSINAEFSEYIVVPSGREVQGYVRVTTRERFPIGAQVIERSEVSSEKFVYTALC